MAVQANKVLAEAMRLSEKDRCEPIAKLLDSLDSESDDDVEAAWAAEIQQRVTEVDRGDARTVPWSIARQRIIGAADGPPES